MEESYSSDDDIYFGPLTTKELRRNLTKNVRPIVDRRHTVGSAPDCEELLCGAEIPTFMPDIPSFMPDIPELIKEVASNLDISLSSENLSSGNESKTELDGNFVEKVSQILSDSDKSKSLEDVEASFKLNTQPMNITQIGNNIRTSCLLDNMNVTLVNDTFLGKDIFPISESFDDSLKENSYQNSHDVSDVIILTSDEESSFNEKLSVIIEKLDEDLAVDEKEVVEISDVDEPAINLTDVVEDNKDESHFSELLDDACATKVTEKITTLDYSDISLDYEYDENKAEQILEEEMLGEEQAYDPLNSASVVEFCFNEKLVESSLEESIDPENKSLDDTYCTEENSEQSLNFNNTLEQIEYFLNKEKEESAKKIIIKEELNVPKKDVPESHIPIRKLNKNTFLETNQNQFECKDKFSNVVSPIAAYIHKPTIEQKTEFKIPNKPPPRTPNFSKLPSTVKTGYFKNIVSPVSLYIKNTPTSPLIQHVPNKIATPSSTLPNIKRTALQENTFPCVSYKPAKHKLFTEEKDLNLPKNIKKLGTQGTLIIKHEKRIGSTKENVFDGDIDASLLNTTNQDVSVLTSKNCYI